LGLVGVVDRNHLGARAIGIAARGRDRLRQGQARHIRIGARPLNFAEDVEGAEHGDLGRDPRVLVVAVGELALDIEAGFLDGATLRANGPDKRERQIAVGSDRNSPAKFGSPYSAMRTVSPGPI
jgi:hypothetical protein